jgi:hypothetical protein
MNRQRFYSFQQITAYTIVAIMFVITSCGVGGTSVPTTISTPPSECSSTPSSPLYPTETIRGVGSIADRVCLVAPPFDHFDPIVMIIPGNQRLQMFVTEHTTLNVEIGSLKVNSTVSFAATAEQDGTLDITELGPPQSGPNIVTYQGKLSASVGPDKVLNFTVNPENPNLSFHFTITDDAVLKNAQAIQVGQFITVQVQFYDPTGTDCFNKQCTVLSVAVQEGSG